MNLYMGNSTKKEKFVNKKSKNMFESIINGIDENVHAMNNSKIFAGLMIITLNISYSNSVENIIDMGIIN